MIRVANMPAPAAVMTVQSISSLAVSRVPCRTIINRAIVISKWARATAIEMPRNFPMTKVGRLMGLERTVVMVPDSISSVIAPVEAKTAMNKPARKSVDSPNSRRSIISSSSVYMLTAGAKSIKSREKTIMTA